MKKKWTKEEFIEECNKIMEFNRAHGIFAKQDTRRKILKKMRNKNAKSKLQRTKVTG